MKNILISLLVICPALSFADGHPGAAARIRGPANVHVLKSNQLSAARAVFHEEHLIVPLTTSFKGLLAAAKSSIQQVSAILGGFLQKGPIQCPGAGAEGCSTPDSGKHATSGTGDPDPAGDGTTSSDWRSINLLSRQGAGGGGGDDPDDRCKIGKSLPADNPTLNIEDDLEELFKLIKKEKGESENTVIVRVKQYLMYPNHSVNDAGRDGTTLLHVLSEYGYVEAVRYLLKLKADPNLCNSFAEVPLQLAIESASTAEKKKAIAELLIAYGAELNTKFCGNDGGLGPTPLECAALEKGKQHLHAFMQNVHQQRLLKVLQGMWKNLSRKLKKQFITEFSCLAYFLGVANLQDIDAGLLSSAEAEKRIKELLKRFDKEYLLSELLMQIIEGTLNFIITDGADEWILVDRAGFLLIEYFRELSLSSVDVADVTRKFESFYIQEKGSFLKRLHRLPFTLCAVLRPPSGSPAASSSSDECSSDACLPVARRVYLGRTASRNNGDAASRERDSRSASAPPVITARLSALSSCSGGSSGRCSVQGSRTPQQCGEYQAFSAALSDRSSDDSVCSFAAVEIQDLVCRYGFKDRRSEAANPRNKPPCMNCRVLYADHVHNERTVREQYFIFANTEGQILGIEEYPEKVDQIDDQVIAFITILVDGVEIEAEVRVSRSVFERLVAGIQIMFDLVRDDNSPLPLMIIKSII